MALLLAPGFMLDGDLWSDMASELADLGPIVDVDLGRDETLEGMARRALEQAPERFVAVGFSMGGYVAREIVRLAPKRAIGLVLIATSARGDMPEQQRRKSLRARFVAGAPFGGLSRQAVASSLHPDRADDAELIVRIQAMAIRLGGDTFQRQCMLPRPGDLDRLSEIHCPTLIVAAGQDRLRSVAEAEELHAGISGSELVVTKDGGHMLPLEIPQRLADLVTTWFKTHAHVQG